MTTARTLPSLLLPFGLLGALTLAHSLFAAGAPSSQPADIPGIEKQDLFVARTAGYTVYRIPGLIVTGRGTLLAYCEARKQHGWDWDPIDILLRRSTDGGRTWEAPRAIAIAPENAKPNPAAVAFKRSGNWVTLNNPVMIAGPGATVHFLYDVNYGRCFYRRSEDDGVTFSAPVEITPTFEKFRPEYNWLVIGTGPGHGIRLTRGAQTGRLVVPVWLALGTKGNGHHPSCAGTVFSDDDGKTWQRGDLFARVTPDIVDPNETAVVQLSDGRVMANTRTDTPRNRRLVAMSPDGATHWTEPAFDETLFDPVCFGSLIGLPDDPGVHSSARIVFAIPDSSALPAGKSVTKPRRNLTLRLSKDDGRTWPIAKVLEPGIAAYSDLAAAPDGTLYCLYERDGLNDMFDTKYLTIARIAPGWLSNDSNGK